MALKAANSDKEWLDWTVETADDDVTFMWYFIQYEFFRQWKDVLNYAHQKGVKVMRTADEVQVVSIAKADKEETEEQQEDNAEESYKNNK